MNEIEKQEKKKNRENLWFFKYTGMNEQCELSAHTHINQKKKNKNLIIIIFVVVSVCICIYSVRGAPIKTDVAERFSYFRRVHNEYA